MKRNNALIDELLTLTITNLKKWGYVKEKTVKKGIISWYKRDTKQGSVNIESFSNKFITLNYFHKGNKVNLKVFLTYLPSNIGKGRVYYFLCPKTNKKCRKLFLINGEFTHREAFKNILYKSQTQSKKTRELKKEFENYFKLDCYYSELYKKHFKRFYNGTETKRYKKLKTKIEKGISTNIEELRRSY